jgi:hypothetical protein
MQTGDYHLPFRRESLVQIKLLDNTPGKLAAALTAYERVMFSCIRPADYIDYVQAHQGPSRVADARLLTDKIIFWVKQKMLRSPHVKQRAEVYKFFLKTAEVWSFHIFRIFQRLTCPLFGSGLLSVAEFFFCSRHRCRVRIRSHPVSQGDTCRA